MKAKKKAKRRIRKELYPGVKTFRVKLKKWGKGVDKLVKKHEKELARANKTRQMTEVPFSLNPRKRRSL